MFALPFVLMIYPLRDIRSDYAVLESHEIALVCIVILPTGYIFRIIFFILFSIFRNCPFKI